MLKRISLAVAIFFAATSTAALAQTLPRAVATAYEAADLIRFAGKHLRRDVAHRALGRGDGAR